MCKSLPDYLQVTLFCLPSLSTNHPPTMHLSWLYVSAAVAGTRPGSGVTSQATGKVPVISFAAGTIGGQAFSVALGQVCAAPREGEPTAESP